MEFAVYVVVPFVVGLLLPWSVPLGLAITAAYIVSEVA